VDKLGLLLTVVALVIIYKGNIAHAAVLLAVSLHVQEHLVL
jgi:hypothetical protein